MNKELTYEERVRWFVNNYYETGMEYASMLESMRNKDLDNFEWYGEKIQIPKFYKLPQPEISDEEIEKAAFDYVENSEEDKWAATLTFIAGCKWYKEQLKNK
jgi:hypothetical protein